MLDLAHEVASGAEDIRRLVLPDDPIPVADAIVSVGHVLNYLPSRSAIDRALIAISQAFPSPTIFGTFKVPERIPRSCPPPSI